MPFKPDYEKNKYYIPDENGNPVPLSDYWKRADEPERIPDSPKEYLFDCVLDYRFTSDSDPYQNRWSGMSNLAFFMDRWHYTHSSKVMPKYVFAIYHPDNHAMSGVIMYGNPAMNQIHKQYSDDPEGIIELRRMVLIDKTPSNTESWFLGKSLSWLAENTDERIVVTYADPAMGHSGKAYKACNFVRDGLSGNSPAIKREDGSIVHDRNLRSRNKDGTLSDSALNLRREIERGKAWHVEMPRKHRYHYHLPFLKRTTTKNKKTNQFMWTFIKSDPSECNWCSTHAQTEKSNKPKVEEKREIITNENLIDRIKKAWSKDTSFLPNTWTENNPAIGQCAVSSLIIQEQLGGRLMKCSVEGTDYTHYYNELPDGSIIDVTKKQFKPDTKFGKATTKRPQEILKWKSVQKRYQLLKQNMTARASTA